MTATIETPPAQVRRRPRSIGDRGLIATRLLLVLAVVCWMIALPTLFSAGLSQFGLLATASPLFLTSFLVTVLAFVVAIRTRRFPEAVAATVVIALLQRLPTSVATDVPLYSWTYKHLGVVDYIQQTGSLAHGVDVYQGWPGLFAVTAWFSDITGVDPLTIAHWFTPAFHLAMVGVAYAAGRAWRLGKYQSIVFSFLIEAVNWVGQDYYSPQATALLMSAGILLLMGLSRRRPIGTPLILIIFGAMVVTHQLTPYWLIIASLGLVVLRRLQPRWLVVAMIAMAGLYLAFNYDTAGQFSLLSFDPVQNAQSNIPTTGVFGQQVTSVIVRILSVGLWAGAALCAWLQKRKRQPILAPVVVTGSSFLLLAGQGYGGEAIFRVFLYSLFGCGLLIAPVLTRAIWGGVPARTLASLTLVVAVAASAQGFYGSWFANRMSSSQVAESHALLATADYPSYLTVAAPVWPERSTERYVPFVVSTIPGQQTYDYPMIYSAKLIGSDFSSAADYDKFIETAGERINPTYLIITRQMAIYDWYFGILPLDALDNLQKRLRNDPRWTVYKDTDEYVIFKSTPALVGAK